MSNRVTEEEVIEILPANTIITEDIILPYINSANAFVTDLLEGELSVTILIEVEKWLAAHMATVTRERLSKEVGAGGAFIKYAGWWSDELGSTQYGQMVLMLDTSNILRNLKDGKRAAWSYAVPGA